MHFFWEALEFVQQERIENLIKERDGNRLANLKGANEGKCGRNATM